MSYAGDLTPAQAWEILESDPDAVLVDVRTVPEWTFVGVPDTGATGRPAVLASWVTPDGTPNPAFLDELADAGVTPDPERRVLLICRSGQRSVAAAHALTAAGFGQAYNVTEGFEGGLDATGHRGTTGWKARGLAWKQS